MKNLHKSLYEYCNKIYHPVHILDIGSSFPANLYSLYHKCFENAIVKCTGIEYEPFEFTFSSLECNIYKKLNLEYSLINKLTLDDSDNRVNYNYYKFYSALYENKEPILFNEYIDVFNFKYNLSIIDFLKNNSVNFDIIIASKVLSHLESKYNPISVIQDLSNILTEDGIIYLKLNSDDFPVYDRGNMIEHTTDIQQPFNSASISKIKDLLSPSTYIELNERKDNFKEYVIISQKSDMQW